MDHERFIVDRIKEAREIRGIPIAELARRSMIESTQLAKVLRYERSLKPGECLRVCYALDMNVMSAMMPDEIGVRLCELNMRVKGDKLG